ncbi:MAG: phosphoribosylaminoimidazolecarboxamide formyltransferase/IMP cyclohydrolase [Sphingobacteriales bacterium]|jgi:phosphoribosylaminoimidazolecarboxamide formyltransferase/IMP cyclohydrolase
MSSKTIKNALISVFHKDGLDEIVKKLHALNVTIYSTGGTQSFIEGLGVPVKEVENLTGYPSILGGRVKTLHPKVFGGILGRRELESDQKQMAEYEIPELDLVIVDLYPFEDTVASGAPEQDIIEKIDIGGISLIRAGAKNFKDVVCCATKADYPKLLDLLNEKNGETSVDDRRYFAKSSFNVSSHYDSAIFNYFSGDDTESALKISETQGQVLRYGENPHQKGVFFGDFDKAFTKLSGKELSYNNLVDVDAAAQLIAEFAEPTFVVIKHTNACGVATRSNIYDAWAAALACDNVSAFGGILAANKTIDLKTAEQINELFYEVLIAPDFDKDALELLMSKKKRILLKSNNLQLPGWTYKTCLNGILAQERDAKLTPVSDWEKVTRKKAADTEIKDLEFANRLVKHTKSNTIILAKGNQLMASGVGQTSRVDALNQAIKKAGDFGFDLKGAVMASDAFFPFPDCVEIASKAGITAVIQPGGSIKDKDSIDKCDELGLSMVLTGTRHFKH